MLSAEERIRIDAAIPPEAGPDAAAIEALKIVQERRGWVSDADLADVAAELMMSSAELDSIATFYNRIYRRPVGAHVIMLCDSVSCCLTGYENLAVHLRKRLGIEFGETSADGLFTLLPAACLGACDVAPAMMIDDRLFTQLDPGKVEAALRTFGWLPPHGTEAS
jgi:NADH-quinone oxidoreductase subunit E